MGMILVRKLDAERMPEEIYIWTGVKEQAESGGGDNQQSR
jgi:hypothetical protein